MNRSRRYHTEHYVSRQQREAGTVALACAGGAVACAVLATGAWVTGVNLDSGPYIPEVSAACRAAYSCAIGFTLSAVAFVVGAIACAVERFAR